MKKKYYNYNKKGSMLIGVLLVFLMIASISLALTIRAIQNAKIVTESKQSYDAYQASDTAAEAILNAIRKLDNDTSGSIPENSPAAGYCHDAFCYDSAGETPAMVENIMRFKKSGVSQTTQRAVEVPLPARVMNPVTDITVKNGTVADGEPNSCNMLLNWSISATVDSQIKNLELRYSPGNSQLNSGSWIQLPSGQSSFTYNSVSNYIVKNSNFSYGGTYYFAVKAKNKNNFSLDSLYFPKISGIEFQAPVKNCSGALGCRSAAVLGSEKLSTAYACCEGTECYKCQSGWNPDNGNTCCTEEYVPSNCACGASSTGYSVICSAYVRDVCNDTYSCSGCDSCQGCDICTGSCTGSPCPPPPPPPPLSPSP